MRTYFLAKENPYNIRQQFTTIDAFKKHLFTLSILEIRHLLVNFEDAEFYEDCVIIQSVLTEKINCIVTRND